MDYTNHNTFYDEDMDDVLDSEVPYDEPCQDNCEPSYRRERFGNNKYHMPKSVAKAKRKAAKISRRKNRK